MTSINNLFKGFKILGLLIILFSLFSGCARYRIEHADAKKFMKRHYDTPRKIPNVDDRFPGLIKKYRVYVHDDQGNTYKGKKNLVNDTLLTTNLKQKYYKKYPETFLRTGLASYSKAIHIHLKDSVKAVEGYSELSPHQIQDIEYYDKTELADNDLTNLVTGGLFLGAMLGLVIMIGVFGYFEAVGDIGSDIKHNNCYVATMAYKDINAPEVDLLRKYRDEKLRHHFLGRFFIFYYYKTSPTFVYLVKDIGWLNKSIKWVLDKYVRYLSRKYGYELAV